MVIGRTGLSHTTYQVTRGSSLEMDGPFRVDTSISGECQDWRLAMSCWDVVTSTYAKSSAESEIGGEIESPAMLKLPLISVRPETRGTSEQVSL